MVPHTTKMFVYVGIKVPIGNTFMEKKSICNSKFPVNEWFNDKSKNVRRKVNNYSKNHDISQQPHSKMYCALEQEYNRIKQKCKREYNNKIRLKLQNLNSYNPDED